MRRFRRAIMTFEELNLAPAILQAVQEQGYDTPTPIQAQAIPIVLAGQDDGDRLGLDGRGCVVALLLHGLQNGRSQIQFFKCHDGAPKAAHGIGLSGCWETAASQRPMGFTGGHGNHRREPGSNPSRSADVAATGGGNNQIVA